MRAAVGLRAALNSVARLETRGYLKLAEAKPAEGKARSYVLFTPGQRAERKRNGGKERNGHPSGVSASELPLSHHVSPLRASALEGVPELT